MPVARFQMPDGRVARFEVPEGTSPEQAQAMIQEHLGAATAPEAPQQQTPANMGVAANAGNKAIAALPDTILNTPTNLWNLAKSGVVGAGRAMGYDTHLPYTEPPNYVQKGMEKMGLIDPAYDPKTAGQRLLAAGTGGAVSAAMNPASSTRQLAALLASGATAGLAGQGTKEVTGSDTAGMVASMLTPLAVNAARTGARNQAERLVHNQSVNAPRDETLRRAMDEGYLVPPATVNPSATNRVLESVAGKAATQQGVSTRNTEVTDRLARRAIGLPEDAPLTVEATRNVRREAFQHGYEPIAQAGQVGAGRLYRQELDAIEAQYQGAARSFPGAVRDDVREMLAPLRQRNFDAGDGIQMSRILREDASQSFATGNAALGNAQRRAAEAIENQIERGLAGRANSAEMLRNFRAARTRMAQSHTVEDAIKEGGGSVDANKIARELQGGAPLTGDLETIARFANVYQKANQTPQVVGSQGVSKSAALASALFGGGGAAMAGPAGVAAGALPFVVPPAVQSLLLSRRFQNAQLPDYQQGMLARILADAPDQSLGAMLQQQQMAEQLKRGQ